jgi:hypothetical protein
MQHVSRQRIGKHVSAQILRMQRGKRGVAYPIQSEDLKIRKLGQTVQLIVGSQFCTGILKEKSERGKLKNLHC